MTVTLMTLVVLFCTSQTADGVTTYFNWSHSSSDTSDIKQYVLSHFHTDTSYAFGWKFSGNADSLKLAHDPDGSGYVLQVFYEDGTRTDYDTHKHHCTTSHACKRGAQFYIMPPQLIHHGKTFAALEYEVYFKSDFDFADGGKLPGLFGGRRDSCKGCSGEAHDCFSARLMWRSGGHYEVYAYIPWAVQDNGNGWDSWCNKYGAGDRVKCHSGKCGTEIGLTTSDKFVAGQWYKIREEVNLGSPNGHGRISLWVDGTLKVQITNIVLRTSSSVHVDGVFFSTFYGGKAEYFGNHGDTWTYFRNFRVTDEKYPIHSGEVFIG